MVILIAHLVAGLIRLANTAWSRRAHTAIAETTLQTLTHCRSDPPLHPLQANLRVRERAVLRRSVDDAVELQQAIVT